MRKIFSILVVLMMVAGTFVSCSMPTNDSTGTETPVRSDIVPTDPAPVGIIDGDDHLCVIKYKDAKFWCTGAAANIFLGKDVSYTFSDVAGAPYYDGLAIKDVGLSYCGDDTLTSAYIIYKSDDFEPNIAMGLHLGPGDEEGILTYNGEKIKYRY